MIENQLRWYRHVERRNNVKSVKKTDKIRVEKNWENCRLEEEEMGRGFWEWYEGMWSR